MIYKYDDCPLFLEEDREPAIEFVWNYLSANNKINRIEDPDLPRELTDPKIIKESIMKSYGVNVTTMANVLSVQNMYLGKYMNSIIEYLNFCGQKAYSSTIQMATMTPYALVNLIRRSRFKALNYWDPNEKWSDFVMSDDVTRNVLNPTNIFYTSYLVIKDVDKDFTDFMMKNTRLNNLESFPSDRRIPLSIQMIPSYNPAPILEIIKAIHSYF
jgi:hypothetical protein